MSSWDALWPDDLRPEPGCREMIVRGLLFVGFCVALYAVFT